MIPFLYILTGWVLLFALLGEHNFNKTSGILEHTADRFVFILSWPAFVMVMLLWRFCRDDDYEVRPML